MGDEHRPTRRSILRGAAATLGGLSAAGTATGNAADTDTASGPPAATAGTAPDVARLTGPDRDTTIRTALEDPTARQLFQMFVTDHHWRPLFGEATVTRTRYADDTDATRAMVLPFAGVTDGTVAYLAWSSHDDWTTHGFQADTTTAPETAGQTATVYTVEDGEVAVQTQQLDGILGCDDVNLQCVLSIAASYAGLFAGCAACSATLTPPACAACLAAVLTWGAAILCDWCND